MPILARILFIVETGFIIFLMLRGHVRNGKMEGQEDQIKMLSSMLSASLPGGVVNFIDTEILRATEEIESAKARNYLAHESFFSGYRSALRNIKIAICGWS